MILETMLEPTWDRVDQVFRSTLWWLLDPQHGIMLATLTMAEPDYAGSYVEAIRDWQTEGRSERPAWAHLEPHRGGLAPHCRRGPARSIHAPDLVAALVLALGELGLPPRRRQAAQVPAGG